MRAAEVANQKLAAYSLSRRGIPRISLPQDVHHFVEAGNLKI
jgi:hypothetical protein